MEDYCGKDISDSANRSESRKSNKPIMEKRRRARINYCLNELKSLILDAMKKDPARHSKLEKADILEMTVKHLQNVQRQQLAMAVSSDPTVLSKFKNGFSECANEVSRYVSRIEGVDQGVCQRMITHLTRCMSNIQTPPIGLNPLGTTTGSIPATILPNNPYLGRSDLLHPPPAAHGLPDANFHTRLLTSLKAMQHLGDLSLAFFPHLRESQVTLNPLNMIPTSFNNNNNNNVGSTKSDERGGAEGEKDKEQSAFLPVKRARSPSPPPLREKFHQPSNNNKRLKSSVPDESCDTALSLNNNVIEKHSPRLREHEDIPCQPNRNMHTPPSSPLPDQKEASSTDMWRPW